MAYVAPSVYEQLVALKEERGARSLSQTIEEILQEYFAGAVYSTLSSNLFLEQNRQLAQQVSLLAENYQALQEAVVDLQRVILATATSPTLAPDYINFLLQEFEAKQITQKLVQRQDQLSEVLLSVRRGKSLSSQSVSRLPQHRLTGTQLANRLNVNSSTLSRRRSRSDFPKWSQQLDPDRISWSYNHFAKAFYPAEIVIQETPDSSFA